MQHKMHVMSPAAGHSTVEWNPVDELSTQQVREQFDSLVSQGYLGFQKGKLVTEFDPSIDELTMAPLVIPG